MARPVRRITRKDIRRPDQFITLTGKLLELFAQHRTKFLALLTLIVALLFAAWGWDLYRNRQNRLAARILSLWKLNEMIGKRVTFRQQLRPSPPSPAPAA